MRESLFYMRPCLAFENRPNSAWGNIELLGNLCCSFAYDVKAAYFSNAVRAELGRALAFSVSMSLLLVHVCHVVGLCAKKQMRRIVAAWTVAFVEYVQSLWDRAVMNFPGNTMRMMGLTTTTKVPVSNDRKRALPIPTFIGHTLRAICPKMFSERVVLGRKLEMSIDVAYGLSLDPSRFLACLGGYLGFLPAAALTVTVWDFVRGMIGVHGKRLLSVSNPGTFEASPGISIGSYRSDYSMFERVIQPEEAEAAGWRQALN